MVGSNRSTLKTYGIIVTFDQLQLFKRIFSDSLAKGVSPSALKELSELWDALGSPVEVDYNGPIQEEASNPPNPADSNIPYDEYDMGLESNRTTHDWDHQP